jgi:hypothetical protein
MPEPVPIACLDKCNVLYVSSNEDWTEEQTRNQFAMEVGPEPSAETGEARVIVTLHGKSEFSLDCFPGRRFRTTLLALNLGEWGWCVVEDKD